MKRLIIVILFFGIGILSIQAQSYDKLQTDTKFAALLNLIDQYYMDSTDMPKLTESAIKALLKELDPHSVYIPKEDVNRMNEQLAGSFEGIGITYQIFRDTIMVISPTPGGPSEKAGLLAGDKIVKVNNEIAVGKKVDESYVHSKLRGKKGTEVSLGIKRHAIDSLLTYTIIRDKIPMNTISAAFMLDHVTGYIRLARFSTPSGKEFIEALEKLQRQGMESLIFDLRGNSGGYMNIAIDIAEQFLPDGRKVVYTEGLRSPRQEFSSRGRGKFTEGKLIVLVDEGSASASEIVSGAVQDHDRGLLIGRRTYGKGLVQKAYYLPDGSNVRLTTARYFTPSGRCIQRPFNEGTEIYFKEMNRRLKNGELVNADSIHFPDSLKYRTIAGRTVYGGGGIMPDIFMAVDSSITNYYNELVRKGILNDFCIEYVDKNRSYFKKEYKDEDAFFHNFSIRDTVEQDFIAYAGKAGVNDAGEQQQKSMVQVRNQLKALIGRNLYGVATYNRITAEIDAIILKAADIIKNDAEFSRLSQQ
ncbi:MAG: S41 family peptidase [Bacteroidales bacterium]